MKIGLKTLSLFFKQPDQVKLLNVSASELSSSFVQAGLEVESIETDPDLKLIFELGITPNRGDCLSAYGLARELAAGLDLELLALSEFYDSKIESNHTTQKNKHTEIKINSGCLVYFGQVIKNINPNAVLPAEITKPLAVFGSSGSGYAVVDILNYVMFLIGQPMHAFDLSSYSGQIFADSAKHLGYTGQDLKLLNQSSIRLSKDDLVIANQTGPIALAGIMGGLDSAIQKNTQHIFLESACFDPIQIRMSTMRHNLHSDASYRYARGVDPLLAEWAMQYAGDLILKYCGGERVGAVLGGYSEKQTVLQFVQIRLRIARLNQILGTNYSESEVQKVLQKLKIHYNLKTKYAQIPSFRLDLSEEIDLIEEVARMVGYHNIPEQPLLVPLQGKSETFNFEKRSVSDLKKSCANMGLNETVHYSFISPEQALQLGDNIYQQAIRLKNPLSQNWSLMRPSLLPGLIQTVFSNRDHQQTRARLFEIGVCFWKDLTDLENLAQKPYEQDRLAVVLSGSEKPEQWGITKSQNQDVWVDFYDLKALGLNLFHPSEQSHVRMISVDQVSELKSGLQSGSPGLFNWPELANTILEPGLGVLIQYQNRVIGYLGKYRDLSLKNPADWIWVLEIELSSLLKQTKPKYQTISKYPSVRRDFSFVMDKSLLSENIESVIREICGELLVDFFVFDQYTGKQIPVGKKNLAVGLILQSQTETLTDITVTDLTDRVLNQLSERYQVSLREQ